jgi:hypothetical protein
MERGNLWIVLSISLKQDNCFQKLDIRLLYQTYNTISVNLPLHRVCLEVDLEILTQLSFLFRNMVIIYPSETEGTMGLGQVQLSLFAFISSWDKLSR